MQASTSPHGPIRLALALSLGMLVTACGDNEAPDDDLSAIHPPEIVRVVPAHEALAGAIIPALDPAPMNDAEIIKALGAGPLCQFRYTKAGRPVLAIGMQPSGAPSSGILKVNGSLVSLSPTPADGASGPVGTILLAADPIRMTIASDEEAQVNGGQPYDATAIFEVGRKLKVGYRGYVSCASEPSRTSPRH